MLFAPDAVGALEFAVLLCNTVPGASRSGKDELATPAQLTALLHANLYSGRVDGDADEVAQVHETRERIRRAWSLERDSAALEVNGMLADARALPYLMRHDGLDWHLHGTELDAPLAERIRVEIALALVDVIRSDECGRLRVCAAEDCSGLLLDVSRNGSKRFCSVRCGNRVNTIAFRARRAGR